MSNSNFSCVVLNLFKSSEQGKNIYSGKQFIIWGSLDFLNVKRIDSLSQLVLEKEEDQDFALPFLDQRSIYLYKSNSEFEHSKPTPDWIFGNFQDYPLLVITFVKVKDFDKVKNTLLTYSSDKDILSETYNTLGHGAGIIVFRGRSYSHILERLIELNKVCQNTYSISGVQNPWNIEENGAVTGGKYLFTSLNNVIESSKPEFYSSASVRYRLTDRNVSGTGVDNAKLLLDSIETTIIKEMGIPARGLVIHKKYEIGQYDLEVKIDGHIFYILNLLLHENYGLTNVGSDFFQKWVKFSKTTWHSLGDI